MRGGDRLVDECSSMSGKCSGLLHSTEQSETFRYRCPSSVTFIGSEEPLKATASPRGKPRGGRPGVCHSTGCLRKSGAAGGYYPPLQFERGSYTIQRTAQLHKLAGRLLVDPYRAGTNRFLSGDEPGTATTCLGPIWYEPWWRRTQSPPPAPSGPTQRSRPWPSGGC